MPDSREIEVHVQEIFHVSKKFHNEQYFTYSVG